MFKSNRSEFYRKNAAFVDMVLGRSAMSVEIAIKTTAGTPVKHGLMKSDTRHFKTADGRWRVEADKEYAAVQEAGKRRGSKPFKHYTTPGTSAGWFKRAIDTMLRQRQSFIAEARRANNL